MKRLLYLLLLIPFAVKAQTPIEIPVPVKVVNAYSLDWKRGPWATTTAAKAAIPQAIRVGGLKVWITACGCEYVWLDSDLSDAGLIPSAVPGWLLSGTTTLTGDATITSGSNGLVLNHSVSTGFGDAITFTNGSPGLSLNSHNSSYSSTLTLDVTTGLKLATTGSAVIVLDASASSSQNIFIKGVTKLNSTFITNDNTKTKVLVMDGTGGDERLYYNNKFILNPMTTQYDLVIAGASGTPARFAKGADNTFMSVQGGIVNWYPWLNGSGITPGNQKFDWGGTISDDVNIDDNTLGTHVISYGATTPIFGFNVTTVDPTSTTSSDNGSIVSTINSTLNITAKDGTGTSQGYISFDSQGGFTAGGQGGVNLTGRFGGGSYFSLQNDDITMGTPGLSKLTMAFSNSSQKLTISNGPLQVSAGSSTTPSIIFPQTFPSPSSPSDGWLWYDGNQLLFRRSSNSTTYDILAAVKSINVSGGTTGLTFSGGPITSGGTITMAGTLAVANGGTGTSTPGLVAGTNVTITGTWPNQTINSSPGSIAWGSITGTLSSQTDLNTALSAKADAATYTGSSSIVVLGTVTTGTWHGNGIAVAYGGTGQSSISPGNIYYGSSTPNVTSLLAIGTANQSLVVSPSTTLPVWSSVNVVDLNNASTAGSTITLDLNNQYQRMFVGSNTFATGKTMAITNTTNNRVFDFHFEITSTSATLTLPTGWLMSDANWNNGSHLWTPPATGKYEMSVTYDGNYYKCKIAGPFL